MRRTAPLIAVGIGVPLAMVAAGAWFFYVHKDPPPWAPCDEFLSPAQRAARDEYRVGLKPFAAGCALVLMGLIALVTREQRRAGGWPARVPPATRWALAGALAVLALHLWTGTFALHATLAVFGGLAGGEILLGFVVYSAIRYARGRPAFALAWLLGLEWMALVVVLPALLALPLQEGTDYFCINGIV